MCVETVNGSGTVTVLLLLLFTVLLMPAACVVDSALHRMLQEVQRGSGSRVTQAATVSMYSSESRSEGG